MRFERRPSSAGAATGRERTSRWYRWLAVLLFVGLAIQSVQGDWESDFWLHAASVRSFMENPASPLHPLFAVRAPVHTFTIYHLVWALAGRAVGTGPITILKVAAMVNAAGFLITFPRFVRVFVPHRQAPPVALVLTLLAWGPTAWGYSGFLHLNVLGLQLSYPAMFATWLGMLTVVALERPATRGPAITSPMTVIAGFVLFNVHPITFGCIGILSLALWSSGRRIHLAHLAGLGAGALVSALAWPHYDAIDLALGAGAVIDPENRAIYRDVLTSVYPALVGVWLLARDAWNRALGPLLMSAVGLTAVWALGWMIGPATLGRVMPFLVLVLHLRISQWLVGIDVLDRRVVATVAAAAIVILSLSAARLGRGAIAMVPLPLIPESIADHPVLERSTVTLAPVGDFVSGTELVLAPLSISSKLPTFGGKVVAARPVPWIDQTEQRRQVNAFFESPTRDGLEAISPDWLIYEPDDEVAGLRGLGDVVYEDDDIVIVDVTP